MHKYVMGNFLRMKEIIRVLNESKPTKEKTKNARRQANEAKVILHSHKKRKPSHHAKVAVKVN
jgi:hypothetical protein